MTMYITAASFEERCLALCRALPDPQLSDAVVLVDFHGYENVSPYLLHRATQQSTLREKGYRILPVQADVVAPLAAVMQLEKAIIECGPRDVLLDISALPRNYLFAFSRLLATTGLSTKFRYYRPEAYGSELSRGVRWIQAVPGFEGDVDPGGEAVLIVILGFEGYKALYAWEAIGPTKVIALLGDPPYEPEFLETSRQNNRELLEQYGPVEQARLHTMDVVRARAQLQAIYDKLRAERPNCSVIVCPLGTKPQSLAAFAFAFKNSAVGVVYVSSLSYYTDAYSRGWKPKFLEVGLEDILNGDASLRMRGP